jgi:cytochrome c biogenesis protein CcdA
MKRFLKILTLALVVPALAVAQMEEPVTWHYAVEQTSDSMAEVVVTAQIADGWHLYSQLQNGMAMPTAITLAQNENYALTDTSAFWNEPKYTEVYDAEFDDTERFFTGKVEFRRGIRLLTGKSFKIDGKIDAQACMDGRCVPVRTDFSLDIAGKSAENEAVSNDENSADMSLLWFFLLAFGGGLLGILTPCVFPMIPMTISYFMKHGGKRQALFYGFSIVLIYVIVGIVLSAIFGEGFANFISTHWLPNVLFTIIFVVFALSLFGYFEISLPSSWVSRSSGNEQRAGYVGTFFMALTLVLVSFSCTLPIAGAVALGAAGGGFLKPIIGMLGFSLAFALPFTFFAFFPNLLQKLPKSGGWMNTLKVCLGFVELAFALKFLSVPDQTYHWGLLSREVYLSLWIVIFALMGFYLLGKIRFPFDDEEPVQRSWFKFFLAIADFAFVVYMIPGLWGAPLNALSGWLPPMSTQDFNIHQIVVDGAPRQQTNACSTASFADQLHLVAGLEGYFDYDEATACAKACGKPLFLDFTGHGCVNCRKVEQKVLADAHIQQLLNDNFVVCALYVDDKIISLPDDLQISDNQGDKITMLGEKNRHIQTALFHENSQPCYIVVDPADGSILAGPIHYETDPIAFEKFLKEGLAEFEK